MRLNRLANPSALPEIAELSLTAAFLLTMLLGLGTAAVQHAHGVYDHVRTELRA